MGDQAIEQLKRLTRRVEAVKLAIEPFSRSGLSLTALRREDLVDALVVLEGDLHETLEALRA